MTAAQHRIEALEGVEPPLLHEPAYHEAPVQVQRLEELRLWYFQALLWPFRAFSFTVSWLKVWCDDK